VVTGLTDGKENRKKGKKGNVLPKTRMGNLPWQESQRNQGGKTKTKKTPWGKKGKKRSVNLVTDPPNPKLV